MARHPIIAVWVAALVILALMGLLVVAPDQSKPESNRRLVIRRSYEESCRELPRDALLDAAAIPTLTARPPRFDDDRPFGVRFFRVRLADCLLENLTLPRTFFGLSEIAKVSFRNTDLSESVLCWNDFIDIDFTDADLSRCDLRRSIYTGTKFVSTNLRDADLRRSSFKGCSFIGADLHGAKLTRKESPQLGLSRDQEAVVDWQESEGPEPPGG